MKNKSTGANLDFYTMVIVSFLDYNDICKEV